MSFQLGQPLLIREKSKKREGEIGISSGKPSLDGSFLVCLGCFFFIGIYASQPKTMGFKIII